MSPRNPATRTALPLRCACGTLRGELRRSSTDRVTRVVCYCADCRAFARWLDADAPPLDADGGSDIVQVSPACLTFTSGEERLACLRLSPGGLFRWYASCCRTPVCNTVDNRQLPFAGVSTRLVQVTGERPLDTSIGPVRAGIQAGRDHGIRATWPVHDGVSLSLVASSVRHIGGWRLRGDHRRSPLADADTGTPRVNPDVLSREERAAL